jgi:hypothetical protein
MRKNMIIMPKMKIMMLEIMEKEWESGLGTGV